MPSIYFAHEREVFHRDGMWLAVTPFVTVMEGEEPEVRTVRFRTVGDASCTGASSPRPPTSTAIIDEVAATRITERGATRADDRASEAGDGRPEARGVLLMETPALRHRRFGRRRQVDADRPSPLRREVDLRGPARGRRRRQRADGPRRDQPRAAHRRPAGRARAGHHDRRRLPLLRHTRSGSSSSPTPPGHMQYTRNMVTGASTADLAVVLIDARKGVIEQSRRHAFIASLLRIPHLVLCVNKMDLVDYSEDRFDEIVEEFRSFAMKLDVADLTFIPMSALNGDNVVTRSRQHARGTTARRCCTTSRTCTSRRTATSSTPASRCSTCCGRSQRRVPRLPRLRGPDRRRGVQAR